MTELFSGIQITYPQWQEIIINLTHTGDSAKGDFLLRFRINNSPNSPNNGIAYNNIFDKHLKKNILVNMTSAHKDCFELTFNVIFKDPKQKQLFIKDLSDIPEIDQVMLMAVESIEE